MLLENYGNYGSSSALKHVCSVPNPYPLNTEMAYRSSKASDLIIPSLQNTRNRALVRQLPYHIAFLLFSIVLLLNNLAIRIMSYLPL